MPLPSALVPHDRARFAAWPWAVALVAALQLLTLAGRWYIEDHFEVLSMTRRLLHDGTFTLWRPGEPPAHFAQWHPGEPVRSRFLPTTSLVLLPFLAVDEALGWGDPEQFGRLVHLQGFFCVVGVLVVLGRTLRRAGVTPQAITMAVVVTGLSWPMWLISRRVGPEPILALLVGAFVAVGVRPGGTTWAGRALRCAICVLLAWVHATGPLISFALAASVVLEAFGPPRTDAPRGGATRSEASVVAASSVAGILSVVVLWNYLYQGNWLSAGYAPYSGDQFFLVHNPLAGLWFYSSTLLMQSPFLFVLAGLGCLRGSRNVPGLAAALCVTLVLLLFFAPFAAPEPARRLAASCPAWGFVVGSTWDRRRWQNAWPKVIMAAAVPLALACLIATEGFAYLMPDGSLYFPPHYLWPRLIIRGAPLSHTLLPVLALLALALFSLDRVWGIFRGPTLGEGAGLEA